VINGQSSDRLSLPCIGLAYSQFHVAESKKLTRTSYIIPSMIWAPLEAHHRPNCRQRSLTQHIWVPFQLKSFSSLHHVRFVSGCLLFSPSLTLFQGCVYSGCATCATHTLWSWTWRDIF